MKGLLLENAWCRALIPLLLMGVVGVTASSLVAEITINANVIWQQMFQKISFYALLAAIFLSAIYQIALSRHDRDVAKGFTPRQYEAAIRNRVAEDVATRCKKLIKGGNIEQLERETEAFKRMYGEEKQ